MSATSEAALRDLAAARTSDGAPSARNLIVTVFGDALRPHGDDTEISVRSLATLLAPFGVSERLVRTSLTRLVNDDLLAARSEGRRSYYRVATAARDLFRAADDRIYDGGAEAWDGSWSLVVIDGGDSTAGRRARLRQELAWAGFGVVAPNVLASPVVPATVAAEIVERVGDLGAVLVSRSELVEHAGTLGGDELARRCLDLDGSSERHRSFVERFGRFEPDDVARLGPVDSFKLRILAVSAFRRLVLTEPLIPRELVPADWPGVEARRVVARIYRALAERSEAYLLDHLEPARPGAAPAAVGDRFGPVRD